MCGIILSTTEAKWSDLLETGSQGCWQQLGNENSYSQIRTITRPSNIRDRNCQQSKISVFVWDSPPGADRYTIVAKTYDMQFFEKKPSHLNCSYISVVTILQNAVESSLGGYSFHVSQWNYSCAPFDNLHCIYIVLNKYLTLILTKRMTAILLMVMKLICSDQQKTRFWPELYYKGPSGLRNLVN